MPVNKISWVNGLDSIRFILALIVLLSHLHNPYTDVLKGTHLSIAHFAALVMEHLFCGAAAVTGFFIISGFVIHYPNRHKNQLNVGPFLLRRWVRIGIPMLVVSLIAIHYRKFQTLPLWSLYCELVYYTLYPLLFRIEISWKIKLYIAYGLSIALIGMQVAVAKGILPSTIFQIRGIYWQACIALINLPCWMLGVLLAEKADAFKSTVSTSSLWLMRGSAWILSIFFLVLKTHYHINYTYSLVFFALFLYHWLRMEIIYHRSTPNGTFSEYLGRFSYSLYLCHMLCFALITQFFPVSTATYFLYIMMSIIMSYVAYLLIEYPSHKLARLIGI